MDAGLAMMASKSSAKSLMSVAESESVHSVCMCAPGLKCKTHRQHTQKRPVNVYRPLFLVVIHCHMWACVCCVQKANCMARFVAVRITGLQYAAVSVAKSAVDVKIRCLSQLLLLHIICNQYDCVHNFASLGF